MPRFISVTIGLSINRTIIRDLPIMLDAYTSFETPEGINIRLAAAGPLPRALAWLIDLAIRAIVYIIAAILLTQLGQFGQGIMLIIIFFFEWLYPTLFEALRGATPGKQVLDLYVTMDDGTSLSWSASFARNLLRTIDFLPFMYVLGFISCLSNSQFKRIGDLMAGTLVVYNQEEKQNFSPTRLDEPARALPLNLTAAEQRLILEFSDRCEQISPSRQEEIANILAPILPAKDKAAVQLIKQYAAWIKGGQS